MTHFYSEALHGQYCVNGTKTTLKSWVQVQAITPGLCLQIVFSKMKGPKNITYNENNKDQLTSNFCMLDAMDPCQQPNLEICEL